LGHAWIKVTDKASVFTIQGSVPGRDRIHFSPLKLYGQHSFLRRGAGSSYSEKKKVVHKAYRFTPPSAIVRND